MVRCSDALKAAIKSLHKIETTKERLSRVFNRVDRSLDRQETKVIRLLQRDYEDCAVISDGKAHVMIDGSLYVLDVVDLDAVEVESQVESLEYRSVNAFFDPVEVLEAIAEHESVVSDGAAS